MVEVGKKENQRQKRKEGGSKYKERVRWVNFSLSSFSAENYK
jgi:hypothetical protein